MSWDVVLTIKVGDMYNEIPGTEHNYTYNVAPMYYAAGIGEEGIRVLNGKSAMDAMLILTPVINYMENHREELEKLNPSNKWGDFDGALEFLQNIKKDCEQYPLCSVYLT